MNATDLSHKIVLYADDDSDDRLWVSDACQSLQVALQMRFVENGRQALEYLEAASVKEIPSIIVLDLNMPELDGRQTLKRLKANPRYKNIPVVIVTTSASKMDKEICERLGAALYLTKPYTHQEWQNIIQQLTPYLKEA